MPGKYQYGRGRIVANFDFGRELDAHMAMRRNAAEGGGGAKLSKLFQAVGKGSLTLKQVRDQEPAIYFAKGNLAHFQKLRGDFLAYQDAPESVMNFYVFGEGGTGKDLLAKALARALAPDADKPYFKVGGENVSWEGYDGEPVVIWEDMRVGDMIRTAKSRGMLFRILGPWREPDEKPIVNIKGSKTQLLNRVNIVTGSGGLRGVPPGPGWRVRVDAGRRAGQAPGGEPRAGVPSLPGDHSGRRAGVLDLCEFRRAQRHPRVPELRTVRAHAPGPRTAGAQVQGDQGHRGAGARAL
ncbi:hypothetical protein [Brevibacterium ravenspurgense]|uniref:hypothetical protein n=1 Tax=Brevibacterium ravenspurgense TaxID=479117 RepID=UPI003CC7C789